MFVAMSRSLVERVRALGGERHGLGAARRAGVVATVVVTSAPVHRRRSRRTRRREEDRDREAALHHDAASSAARMPRGCATLIITQLRMRSGNSASRARQSDLRTVGAPKICGRCTGRKKTDPGTIPGAGQPSSTRGLAPARRTVYMRAPVKVAAASGAGVPA